ncbi:MAG TPA: ferredoxin [Kiritimatiellia bacterium]|nr:ferredoxin [Kiritimatiellia bacterium]
MKVTVDDSTCTGCEVCTDLVPEVFEMGDDMISRVILDPVPETLKEKVQEAVDNCPVTCIEIQD